LRDGLCVHWFRTSTGDLLPGQAVLATLAAANHHVAYGADHVPERHGGRMIPWTAELCAQVRAQSRIHHVYTFLW
jgi:hypothetical protein